MSVLDLRESVSAATHGAALIAAIPAAILLLRRGGTDRSRRLALLSYALGLSACFAASTACHALVASGRGSRTAVMIDRIGIYLLIAGTYTPIVATLLPEGRRRSTLRAVWLAAAFGMVLDLTRGPLPAPVATSFYLAMGWGGLWCYSGMRPALTHAQLALVPLGGVLYSVGAMFHVTRGPVLWPGVFGAHELFHVFVVGGAAAHFGFIWRHVPGPKAVFTPETRAAEQAPVVRVRRRPMPVVKSS